MLYDRKEGKGGDLPPAGFWGRVTHFRDVPDELRGLGMGLVPPGGEDHQSLEWNRGVEGLPEGVVWVLRGPSDWDPPCSWELTVLGRHRQPRPWGLDPEVLGWKVGRGW